MAQKNKNLQELIEMVNSIFGDNVIIAKNTESNQGTDVKNMINDTFKNIYLIKEKPLTPETIDMVGAILKNALVFDEEDAKLAGEELTIKFKNCLSTVFKAVRELLLARVKEIDNYSKRNVYKDDLYNKSKEELIAIIRKNK
jgi:hypothetical protein